MLIISKKKDYYDGVVGSVGIDKSIVYDRTLIEFDELEIPEIFHRLHRLGYNALQKTSEYDDYSYFIVGFCGKLYLGWKFYKNEKSKNLIQSSFTTDITYDREFARTQINQFNYGCNIEDIFRYFDDYNAQQLFIKLKTPIFVFDVDYQRSRIGKCYRNKNSKFFVNQNLNEYQFYKVFDAFRAFQEIQMFIGNVLTDEKKIINIDDKYKITQHGFDKWSFRKESTKK